MNNNGQYEIVFLIVLSLSKQGDIFSLKRLKAAGHYKGKGICGKLYFRDISTKITYSI